MISKEISQHKTNLKNYFDGEGFDRWAAIYSDAENLSFVRKTIAQGHHQMLAIAHQWLTDTSDVDTVLDAGCGTGLFSVAMANQGYAVTAIDISPKMVSKTRQYAEQSNVIDNMGFVVGDIENLQMHYDAVACFDVLVHYPPDPFIALVNHLAQRCSKTLLLTYAPYNRFLAGLHRIGGWFPQDNRRTEIQMTPDTIVVNALASAGMRIHRSASVSRGFYHVKLVQAFAS
ncbi:MAG: magnesium protoporphyrin IX methyltransferase [Chloroflexota bacterium]